MKPIIINGELFGLDMSISKMAVLGAGQMGNGITQVAACAGIEVVMIDIKQEFVTSAQITVDMPYVVTNKVGTTYSLSGNNITPSVTVGDTTTSGKIGGINVGSLTNGVPAMIQTDTTVTTSGSAFSKTESVIMGDATPSTVTPSSGIAALPVLSGQTTVGSGGTAGSLALTSLSSGVHTCTAGGSGTSCIGSTKVTITID